MRLFRILCFITAIVTALAVTAYNPENPTEPGEVTVSATVVPAGSGSVSRTNNGRGLPGTSVVLSATPYSNYKFVQWESEDGRVLSKERRLTYVLPLTNSRVIARMAYTPVSPDEPSKPVTYANVSASVKPSQAGYVNGAGKYATGSSVTLWAYNYSNYTFVNWTRGGDVVSTNSSLTITVPEGGDKLVANYRYTPGSPGEPEAAARKYKLNLRCEPAGGLSLNVASGNKYAPGQELYLTATPASGYVFDKWTDADGQPVSVNRSFYFTMPEKETTLTAYAHYSPTNPDEPSTPSIRRNVIYGARTSQVVGKPFTYDISLDNIDECTGISVDFTKPEGYAIEGYDLTDRAPAHSISADNVTGDVYRIAVRGSEAIRGGGGVVVRVRLVPDGQTPEVGATVAMNLAKGVLIKADASQTAIDAVSGSVFITEAPEVVPDSPDFVVTDIKVAETEVAPGGNITVSWIVSNTGNAPAYGGWTENVWLIDATGKRAAIGSLYYDLSFLAVGDKVSRTAAMTVPQLPGIDGSVNIGVSLTPAPAAGELEANQLNNTTETETSPLSLTKLLVIDVPATATEGTDNSLRCRLARSGSWSASESFAIEVQPADSRIVAPEQVTIPRDQSAAYFQIRVDDNDLLDENSQFTVTASGNGYSPVSANLTVTDNEFPEISVEPSTHEVTEGESFMLALSLPVAASEDVTVNLSSDAPSRLRMPAMAVIAKGQQKTTVEVTAVDNDDVEDVADITIRATAAHYQPGETFISLADNDMPVLEMDLTPAEVSEGAGPMAIRCNLRRLSNIDKRITVQLSDDSSNGLIYTKQRITLEPGVEQVDFSIGVADNDRVDGDRKVTVTAAVFLSGCSCSVSGQNGGTVSRTVTIIDNDGPSLTLSASKATLRRDSRTSRLTVVRNTPTTKALEVNLTAEPDGMITIPATVIIPSGSKSATVDIEATDKAFQGHEIAITVNATANGFAKGICPLLISDRTLPDAVPGNVTIDSDEVMPGADIKVTAEVRNDGNAPMSDAATVDFYITGRSKFETSAMTSTAVEAGGKTSVTAVFKAPDIPGRYGLTARVNDAATFAELTAANNMTQPVWFTVLSPFTATVASDRNAYNVGDVVTITGVTPGFTGEVEVYFTDGTLRQSVKATADNDGNFTATWTPRSGGAYSAGVCIPGENKSDAMCSFNVMGLMFDNNSYATYDVSVGEKKTLNVRVRNTSPVVIDKVSFSLKDVPQNCSVTVGSPIAIAAGATGEIPVTIEALKATDGKEWERFKIVATDGNGLADTKTIYFYGRNAAASLVSSISSINTSMTMGTTRSYSFMIANNGKAATGDITLSLPPFMRMQSASTLPSLAQGQQAEVILMLTPSAEMQLNSPITGKIAVNCAYGDGIVIPYSVEPVSDVNGRLVIDAKDEYTFYTAEGPHVAGADVIVSHPVTGRLIENGKTDANGIWAVDLPAGFYKVDVSADRHQSWSATLEIAPGRDNNVPVFLSFNAISYSWAVEETTVDDTYEIVNTVEFETRVPKPVVLVTFPELTYTNQIAYITVTNKGLIEARNVEVIVPEGNDKISFELLGDNIYETLGAGQSIYVPMRVHVDYENPDQKLKMSVSSYAYTPGYDASEASGPSMAPARASGSGSCQAHSCKVGVDEYECDNLTGEPVYTGKKKYIDGTYYTGDCPPHTLPFTTGANWGSGSGSGGGGGLPNGPGNPGTSPSKGEYTTYFADRLRTILTTGCLSDCEKALADAIKSCWDAIQNCRSGGDWDDFDPEECAGNLIDACLPDPENPLKDEGEAIDKSLDCGKNAAGCFPPLACPADIFDCLRNAYKAFQECMKLYKHLHQVAPANSPAMAAGDPAAGDEEEIMLAKERRAETIDLMARMYIARIDNLRNLLGDGNWTAATSDDVAAMLTWVQGHRDSNGYIAMDETRLAGKPATVSIATYDLFLERINNSVRHSLEGGEYDNMLDLNRTLANNQEMIAVKNRVAEMGFPDYDAFVAATGENYHKYLEMGKEPSAGVCASITLKFTQTMVMTRQAFRGTLSITNGNDKLAMTDIRLALKVRDEDGNLVGEREFAITPESLNGFTGNLSFSDGWSLAAGGTGEATMLFIPSRYAAPVEPRVYSFGGVLSYVDPFTGTEVSRELSPIDMTVSPSPVLDLTFFMQRDIISDDPLTPDVIESAQPAEFALVIDNKGFGAGRNVHITTRRPEIVDNSKGLAIDFDIVKTALNGQTSTLSIGDEVLTDFGDIDPQTSVYAQWWFKSSLMGHFIKYDVKATQLSAYGSEDMSLLDRVEVHELIHGITPAFGDTRNRAFLVNDIDDLDITPDMLYFSDGSEPTDVAGVAAVSSTGIVDDACIVSVTPDGASDWSYGYLAGNQFAQRQVVSVVRLSDNTPIAPDNFWTTFVTLRNSTAPKHEGRLHFVVKTSAAEQYKVTFTQVPLTELTAAIDGVPDESTVLRTPLTSVTVRFSKPIDENTFAADDIALRCQGKRVDLAGLKIARAADWSEANPAYVIDMTQATTLSGYYNLSVDCAGITDAEGFNGSSAASVSWNQLSDGTVEIKVVVNPADGGEVTPAQGRFVMGEVVEFAATPAEGFDFVSWNENDNELSRDASFSYTAKHDATIVANFAIRRYNVEIAFNPEMGLVTGASSGIYPHNTKLTIEAVAAEGYEFAGWRVNGESVSTAPTLSLTVTADIKVEAVFSKAAGIDEVADGEKLHVYPVPTADRLFIDGDYCSSDSFTFIDVKGSKVIIMTGIGLGVPLNVSRLAPGVYIVILTRADGSTASARIVKL